jgi:3',5'-cyclic AMP phosphodiesterase CpdA
MLRLARTTAVLVLLVLTALPAAQTPAPRAPADPFFIVLADPQLGAFTSDRDFVQETANFEFAVANVNRLRPAFVVICGDLINKAGDPAQTAEYQRIVGRIDRSIPVYNVAGNHDVGNDPTPELVAAYRRQFGPDFYSFRQGQIYGIVIDTSLISSPAKAGAAAAEQETWLKTELAKAQASGARHIVVFQHHSWFLEKADEPAQYFNVPLEPRRRYLDLLKGAGVRYVFAGHYHRNASGRDGDLEMITSGPVGRPLGADPSGIRIVSVKETGLTHTYYGFGSIPNEFPVPPPVQRGSAPAPGGP